jgi:hypothetical protein
MEVRKISYPVLIFLLAVFIANPALVSGKDDIQSQDSGLAVEALKQEVEGLTQTLNALGSGRSMATRSTADLVTTAATRKQHLKALIESNPGEVLRHAISPDVRASLPPDVQPYIEEHVEIEGELEVLVEDYHNGSRVLHSLLPHGRHGKGIVQRLSLHFATEPPVDLHTGSRVRVSGVQVDKALALQSGYTSVEPVAAALSNTFGEQKTAVILVSFKDKPTLSSTTPTQAQNVMFGPGSSVTNFYKENSYQQTWLAGDIYGPYVIPMNSKDPCYTMDIENYAKQAAANQVGSAKIDSYKRFVFAFPGNTCPWWGLGTIAGYPSRAWINGTFNAEVVAHEMGHGFGLYHSHALECGSKAIGTLGTDCSNIEYGDTLDTMAMATPLRHFNAVQKERLGWLNYGNSPPVVDVQSSGVYSIDPYESPGTNPKAIKVRTSSGSYYYVEYRQPVGFDYSTVLNNTNVRDGVVVHLFQDQSPGDIYLLDMTLQTSSWMDPALDQNNSFSDTTAGITIAPAWVGATAGVNVTVSGGGSTCVRANPSISISPAQSQPVQAGTAVIHTVSMTNNDRAACATATFNLRDSVPSGWASVLGTPALSLSPGTSGTTTLQVTSPISAAAGSYPLGVSAVNAAFPAYTASASATDVVSPTGPTCVRANPSVSISPAQSQPVQAGTSVTYTISVTNNDRGCAASNFNQSASVPSGWTASFTSGTFNLPPGMTATTAMQVKSPATATAGSYTVSATSTNGSASSYHASASATYQVITACIRNKPTVKASPVEQQGKAGTTLNYTVSVTNNDNGCGASNFTHSATAPSGWTASFASTTLSLAPGATASTTMKVKSPTSAASGPYTILQTTANNSAPLYSGSATAQYDVPNTPDGGTFKDDFNRTDSSALGNGWTQIAGSLGVQAGQARIAAVRMMHTAVRGNLVGAKQSVAMSFTSVDNNLGPRFGLIVGYQDQQNYHTCYRQTGGSSVLRLSRVVNGVETVLRTVGLPNPPKGVAFPMTCSVNGTTITGTVGTTTASANTAIVGTGTVGFTMGYPTAGKGTAASHVADNFSATVQ